MRKGMKILIWIISIIIILAIAVVGVYFIWFKPKVKTTPISTANQNNVTAVTEKFKQASESKSPTSTVNLTSSNLTNLATYAVSQSPTASKYVTGLTVEPTNNNNVVVYATGKLKNVSSQAKVDFTVKAENGSVVLHYNGGKVGFMSIPQSELFSKLKDNNDIQVNPQTGNITINTEAAKGLNINNISANSSGLNIQLNNKANQSA